ncbi:MAG: tRNA pseudouridine(38-40) synthase TruA [Bacteroidota bacterium]
MVEERFFLDISYKGTHFAGWQIQPNAWTVQAELEKALSTVFGQPTSCMGAGRTDAGVHAEQLMVHVDAPRAMDLRILHQLNGLLGPDVAVNAIYKPVKPDLHARFDATYRAYRYQIIRRKSPIHREFAMWVRQVLDIPAMQTAAKILFEFEEFGSFCKSHAGNATNFCRIDRAEFEETGELLNFHIQADRFLRGMVRATIGTLLLVGQGKLDQEGFRAILAKQDRRAAGPNAPAAGLFLTKVGYPKGSLIQVAGK